MIRLHRMKVSSISIQIYRWSYITIDQITPYKPESGCIQLKSSNYYSWSVPFHKYHLQIPLTLPFRLLFDGKDDMSHDPIAQSSFTYSFSDDDRHKVSISSKERSIESKAWLSRLMIYVLGWHHLEMIRLCKPNLIINWYYLKGNPCMINRHKRMKMRRLLIVRKRLVNPPSFSLLQTILNHQEKGCILIENKSRWLLCFVNNLDLFFLLFISFSIYDVRFFNFCMCYEYCVFTE